MLAFKTPFRLIPKLEILAAFKMGFSKEETDLRRRILASYIKGRYFVAKIDSEGNIMPLLCHVSESFQIKIHISAAQKSHLALLWGQQKIAHNSKVEE